MAHNDKLGTMNQLSAADNHTIFIRDDRWRLLAHERPIAEASADGLRYGGKFAQTRRLLQDGLLPTTQLLQVVLGWQQTDEAWHLGIVVNPELAATRGSRWIELVHWPDPDIYVFEETGKQAGQALAKVLGIGFYAIPPQRPIAEAAPRRSLPQPPFAFDMWRFDHAEDDKRRYVIERLARWRLRRYWRVSWYAMWAVVYFTLSIATLTSDIALPNAGTLLPNPQLLPYLGIATGFLLIILIIWQLLQIARQPNRFEVDTNTRTISAYVGERKKWDVPAVAVQSVYISEILRKREQGPATEYGEINLHLGGGKFQFVLKQEERVEDSSIPQPEEMPERDQEQLIELNSDNVFTDMQATALYIAEGLGGLPVWYDMRMK